MHFRDWKMQVEAVRLLSGLSDEKLTVYAWMSLRGEAKEAVRHLTLEQLHSEDGYKLLTSTLEARYER